MSKIKYSFVREQAETLLERLHGARRFIQVVAGSRQVGKTTMVQQVIEQLKIPAHYATADEPAFKGVDWIAQQWNIARLKAKTLNGAVLALDEIQKIDNWSESVKRLWDEDTLNKVPLHIVILGSSPLLIAKGLTESLAGRFEKILLPHWSFVEMREAFGFNLDEFIYYGGYPGAVPLINDPDRWQRYVLDSLIETTITRDILLMKRIDKPALLRQLFELACRYSGQILSYNKMLGQLHDAGNTTTLSNYLELLSVAGMVRGIPKYGGGVIRQRASSPKLQVLNTALLTTLVRTPIEEMKKDQKTWGRIVESAVGAHLANAELQDKFTLYYWREANYEVDFVVEHGNDLTAIEVKIGEYAKTQHSGCRAFMEKFSPKRVLLIGGEGVALEEFFSTSALHWVG